MRYIDRSSLLEKRAHWGNRAELWDSPKLKEDFKNHFYQKCWYTEVKLDGQDIHIDHFRPKKRVDQFGEYLYNREIASTGYSWLANDVDNYRGCCIHANRRTDEGGKTAYFPLKEGSPLLTQEGMEEEQPLLLDPCRKEDVQLLSFFGRDVVCASVNKDDIIRVTVTETIYNLKHPTIVDCRSKVWNEISKTIEEYKEGEISEKACLRRLSEAVSCEAGYSACAIACVQSLAPDSIKNQLNLDL